MKSFVIFLFDSIKEHEIVCFIFFSFKKYHHRYVGHMAAGTAEFSFIIFKLEAGILKYEGFFPKEFVVITNDCSITDAKTT